jgi:signal recognition particle subunit SEC65
MNITQRLELIDKIGRELQARYKFDEIDQFLRHYNLIPPPAPSYNSKWLYSKEGLQPASTEQLTEIAAALELNLPALLGLSVIHPDCWKDGSQFRLFISHLAIHKVKAMRLKEALAPYHISCFVAHEDINPTRAWQDEILRALSKMDAMLTVHTDGFSESIWCQQEIGFALGRSVKVIALRMEEDPKGFIATEQAILLRKRNAEQVSEEIASILTNHPSTKSRMAEVRSNYTATEDDEVPF